MSERHFTETATSQQTTMKRLTTRNLRAPLDLSDDGTQIIIQRLRGLPAPPSGGTLADAEAWMASLYAALHVWGVLR